MVNGNYVLYGDRPSSETEIVEDHVHSRTAERKNKRKSNRTANELQHSLNLAQLDNDTDSVKYEKKIKEPRLLRYVPTTDVEENFVTEKFETYDLKPTEERPRRYAFIKKPRNPTDGSINYAYSRSSSSCSSPNGNLPTISEQCEQYGTYRVHSAPNANASVGEIITGYETKLDKYFAKPKDLKKFAAKGSHPDSLYRVSSGGGMEDGKVSRALRVLRWPVALIAVCVALAVFVYFLMPDNIEMEAVNGTYWEPVAISSQFQNVELKSESAHKSAPKREERVNKTKSTQQNSTPAPARPGGSKTAEIDFYNEEPVKDLTINAKNKLPVPPVFPSHITPEVQYGNERADKEKLRSAKLLEATNTVPEDSTLKPHITHKPERPLAIILQDITTTGNAETITRAESGNEFSSQDDKRTTMPITYPTANSASPFVYKEYPQIQRGGPRDDRQSYDIEPQIPPEGAELEDVHERPMNVNGNFTSGHSNLFGISIEEAGRMQSTTQSSLYNTRVSPTLPTWRDGDDTTTKKYPVTASSEVPQCRSPRLAMCRGVLPYDLAAAPISILGNPVTTLLPQLQYLVNSNCSERVRHFACAMLEPECNPPPYEPKLPCFNLCRAVADSCDGQMPRELMEMFSCENYNYGYSSCVPAKAPCFDREIPCGDGTCVPRDWICDGTTDCPSGVDEKTCVQCDQSEHQCRSGTCIQKRWLCDGYSDCPDGDDEAEAICEKREPGEEPSGSAPAPSVRRPAHAMDSDNSKELLMTSDTNNGLKRNFTRRPSLSRLTPYSHPAATSRKLEQAHAPKKNQKPAQKPSPTSEEIHIENMKFFEDFEKKDEDGGNKIIELKTPMGNFVNIPSPDAVDERREPGTKPPTRLDKSINNLERVIDGAAMLRKAVAQQEEEDDTIDSMESNTTSVEKLEPPSKQPGTVNLRTGPVSVTAHAPCQSGELRCVDGRCITLAQLCDGTIDCSDHADEDNCYT